MIVGNNNILPLTKQDCNEIKASTDRQRAGNFCGRKVLSTSSSIGLVVGYAVYVALQFTAIRPGLARLDPFGQFYASSSMCIVTMAAGALLGEAVGKLGNYTVNKCKFLYNRGHEVTPSNSTSTNIEKPSKY